MSGFSKDAADKIIERDAGRCAWCGYLVRGVRGIHWSIHHRRPRGKGGSSVTWVDMPANGVVVHGHGTQSCHGLIESNRDIAKGNGFLVSINGIQLPSQVPIEHAVHGWVRLDDDGSFTRVGEEGKEWAHVEG